MPATQGNVTNPNKVILTFVNSDDFYSFLVRITDGTNDEVHEYDSSLFYDGQSIDYSKTFSYDGFDVIVEFKLSSGRFEHYVRRSDGEFLDFEINFPPRFVDYASSSILNQLNSIIDKLSDFDNVLSDINSSTDDVNSSISSLNSLVNTKATDLSSLISSQSQSIVNLINSKSDEISNSISQISQNLSVDLSNISFVSLNGSLGSYKDGSRVSVQGLAGIYIVKSSFMLKNDQNNYIICYQLESEDHSSSLIVPNIFVSLAQ